ncbi:MAG TPA: hypothetical protein V6C63_01385, partial [Allocoleopsis sp.]
MSKDQSVSTKSIVKNRNLIAEKINRRPYGSRVDFVLSSAYKFGFDGETSLLLHEELIIRFKPQTNQR